MITISFIYDSPHKPVITFLIEYNDHDTNSRYTSIKTHPYYQHPKDWQLGVLFAGLRLLSIGAGGIKPCNIAFGADQYTAKGRGQLESFFNWRYFTFTIALVIVLTGVVRMMHAFYHMGLFT